MAFGDEVLANYNLSSAVAIFDDQPTAGWWVFDIFIGFTDDHALQTAAGTLTLDAMTGETGGTGWSEGGSAETIFKASGKIGVRHTTPLRYYDGTRYATLTLLSSNASDTSVEVSVTPRQVETLLPGSVWEEVIETLVTAIPEFVWMNETRTLSAGAIAASTFDNSTAYPQAAAVPDVNVTKLSGSAPAADALETAALASGGIATAEGVSETVDAYVTALSGADSDTLKTISDQIDAIPTVEGVADEVWSATTRTLTATSGGSAPAALSGAVDIYAKVFVDGTCALSALVDDWTGDPIVQAGITSITYSIYLIGRTNDPDQTDRTAITGHADVALDKTAVIYDTLQTDGLATGWNFRHIPDVATNAAFTEAGHTYLAEYKITPTSGQVIIVRFKLQCI